MTESRGGRRSASVFSLSFLDAMTCGFGAVVLFFMIINAARRSVSRPRYSTVTATSSSCATRCVRSSSSR